jgi:hypothetical protein
MILEMRTERTSPEPYLFLLFQHLCGKTVPRLLVHRSQFIAVTIHCPLERIGIRHRLSLSRRSAIIAICFGSFTTGLPERFGFSAKHLTIHSERGRYLSMHGT